MKLSSPAFANRGRMPRKYTGDGEDMSPRLIWDDVPAGTREFMLVCDDPDAPTPQPWVHWVVYSIPAGARGSAGRSVAINRDARIRGKESIKRFVLAFAFVVAAISAREASAQVLDKQQQLDASSCC
jgi:Raf kinase inhibitor-like YbhB/YbcL family protein